MIYVILQFSDLIQHGNHLNIELQSGRYKNALVILIRDLNPEIGPCSRIIIALVAAKCLRSH